MVEEPIEKVTGEEMVMAIKPGGAAGFSEVCAVVVSANGEVGIGVMMELFQLVIDRKVLPDEWQMSVLVLIFKGKGEVGSCNVYRGVKFVEYAVRIIEGVLERRVQELVNVDGMQFGFMPSRRTTDALFAVRRMWR